MSGLAFDKKGNMYIAESGSMPVKKILRISPRKETDTVCSIQCFAVQFLKCSDDGSLYASVVVDRGKKNACILKINPGKDLSAVSEGFIQPVGLAFDSKNNLYVADAIAGKVYKITPEGKRTVFIDMKNDPSLKDVLYHGIDIDQGRNQIFLAGINISGGTGNLLMYSIDQDGLPHKDYSIVAEGNCKHVVSGNNMIISTVNNGQLFVKDLADGSSEFIKDSLLTNSMTLSFAPEAFYKGSLFVNCADKIVEIDLKKAFLQHK
jgi:DNA-binding beta-propeller fold protein YncE